MAALATVFDFDASDQKGLRAVDRRRSLTKKRECYARHLEQRARLASAAPHPAADLARTRSLPVRGAARTAARTRLAKGEVECGAEMPTISMNRVKARKPSVSPLLTCSAPPFGAELDWPAWDSDAETDLPSGEDADQDIASASETSSPAASPSLRPCESEPIAEELAREELVMPEAWTPSEKPTSDEQATPSESEASLQASSIESEDSLQPSSIPQAEAADPSQCPDTAEAADTSPSMQMQSAEGAKAMSGEPQNQNGPEVPQGSDTELPPRREQVFRNVVAKLREQAREAEQQAEEATGRAQEAERQAAARAQLDRVAYKRQALQVEKQRAAQLRKQRNQSAHSQAVKERADRALKEAQAIRDEAETEAASMRAQALADATKTAQAEAEALVQAEMMSAKAEAEALRVDSLEIAMQAEKAKRQAEAEAQAMKMQAEMEKNSAGEAKAEAEAVHAQAERKAKEILDGARDHAAALKARVLAQARQQAQAAQEAAEQRRVAEADAAKAHAEREAAAALQRERSAQLRLAKEMDKQRARQFQKQAQEERRQASIRSSELEALQRQADEERNAIRQQALAEAAELKAKAYADARAIRDRAAAAARAEAQARAEAEAKAFTADWAVASEELSAVASDSAQERLGQAEAVQALLAEAESASSAPMSEAAELSEAEPDWQVLPAQAPGPDGAESSDGEWDVL